MGAIPLQGSKRLHGKPALSVGIQSARGVPRTGSEHVEDVEAF